MGGPVESLELMAVDAWTDVGWSGLRLILAEIEIGRIVDRGSSAGVQFVWSLGCGYDLGGCTPYRAENAVVEGMVDVAAVDVIGDTCSPVLVRIGMLGFDRKPRCYALGSVGCC